jgi:hypothetical protein
VDLRLALLVLFLATFVFQLYPSASYQHALFSIGPFLVVAAFLQEQLWGWLSQRLRAPAWRALALAVMLAFPAMLVPAAVRGRAEMLRQHGFADARSPAEVHTTLANHEQLRAASEVLADLPANAPVFAYPAMPSVYLLTGHPNPTRESYLPPGYVDEARQRDVIARLEQTQTRIVIWDQGLVDRWGLQAEDRLLVDYLWRTYQPVRAEGPWVFLERQPQAAGSGQPVLFTGVTATR